MNEDIKKAIQNQIQSNSAYNLLYKELPGLMQTGESFVNQLRKLAGNGRDVHNLIDFTVQQTLEAVCTINQYINISASATKQLREIYRSTWQKINSGDDVKNVLLYFHYPALGKWLAEMYPGEYREALENSREIGRVPCDEYTAEFQLKVLGIEPGSIKEPVLDIGCGSHALLVEYLRELGLEACGIERFPKVNKEYILSANWLEYCYEPGRWGTIISNMSFSNHFNFHYVNKTELFGGYALKYREILSSLKPGGSFYYAPALPFIEGYLDSDKYSVSRSGEGVRVENLY